MVEQRVTVDRLIEECRARYQGAIPFEDYRNLRFRLDRREHGHVQAALGKLGFVVSNFATGPEGKPLGASFSVVEQLGLPISLTSQRGIDGPHFGRYHTPSEPGDEVWEFSSSRDSWEHLAGCAGVALVRQGVVVDISVTMRS